MFFFEEAENKFPCELNIKHHKKGRLYIEFVAHYETEQLGLWFPKYKKIHFTILDSEINFLIDIKRLGFVREVLRLMEYCWKLNPEIPEEKLSQYCKDLALKLLKTRYDEGNYCFILKQFKRVDKVLISNSKAIKHRIDTNTFNYFQEALNKQRDES